MSFINPSADQKPADVSTATVAAPVEVKSGEDVQTQDERKYTGAELELIVRDRLVRERKKFDKEKAEWQSKLSEPEAQEPVEQKASKQVNPALEQQWKSKLTDIETKNRNLASQLAKYRDQSLTSTIERELVAQGCVDPELVSNDFKARKLVEADEDGNVIVGELFGGKLEHLVADYLSKKPHLKRAESVGGAGTRGPKLAVQTLSERDQLIAQVEATRSQSNKLFGR